MPCIEWMKPIVALIVYFVSKGFKWWVIRKIYPDNSTTITGFSINQPFFPKCTT